MQVFVPEHRRAEIVVEVGRMEEQSQLDSGSSISEIDESTKRKGLKQQSLGGPGPSNMSEQHLPTNAAREAPRLSALEVREAHLNSGAHTQMSPLAGGKSEARADKHSNSVEASGFEAGCLGRKVRGELGSEHQNLPSSLVEPSSANRLGLSDNSRQGVSASQEQEDVLEAWRKKRRQEFAALEGGTSGGDYHKRGPEADLRYASGVKGVQDKPQTSKALNIPGDKGKGMDEKGGRWQGSDEQDEELFKKLRKRLGVEPSISEPLSTPLSSSAPPAIPHPLKRDSPLVAPTTPIPQNDSSSHLQTPETFQNPETLHSETPQSLETPQTLESFQTPETRPYRHSFPQSPRGEPARQSFPLSPAGEYSHPAGEYSHSAGGYPHSAGGYSHPLRFTSNTPPVSPRRSLSPAASSGKRSVSEPATSRMHPTFSPPNSESSPSRPSSPSSSESSQASLKRGNSFDSSPPETPTSSRGLVFEPPARSSGLLTAEDEALLAAMSIVGRTRSRGSPASRRLPRGNSGLPPQHVPPSLLRRAVSIDPRVEARAVEQRASERSRGVGEKAKIGDRSERGGFLSEGEKGSPLRDSSCGGFRATEAQSGEGREEGSEKRLKRSEGDSAGSAGATEHASWEENDYERVRKVELEESGAGRRSSGESLAAADETFVSSAGEMREQGVGPHSEASVEGRPDVTGAEAPGRVKGVNRGLVLQILGFDDEDDLEGFGRFLSPVRTKVSDKSRLAKKRSNSFSEFTTVPSPPKVPPRMGGGFEREEWSPSRGRKGFGFAGVSRPRKQAPMQPAVANLIAETVEDFWSSDLMGAWGMGQGDPEEEPGSAPGGNAAKLESTSANDANHVSHRRAISEGSAIMTHGVLENSAPSLPGGLPLGGALLPGQATETTDGELRVTGGMTGEGESVKGDGGPTESGQHAHVRDGKNDATSASGASRKLARVVEESPAVHAHRAIGLRFPLAAPLDDQPARLEEHLPATRGFEAGVRNFTSSKNVRTADEPASSRGGVDCAPDGLESASDPPIASGRGGAPRVGPPLLDDVFDDSPDVTRLREEIHQREGAIRKMRSARDQ